MRFAAAGAAVLAVSLALTGCQQDGSNDDAASDPGNHAAANNEPDTSDGGTDQEPAAPAAVISSNVTRGAQDVAVNTPVSVSVTDGTLDSVLFTMHGS
jgi:hypothetical protein